MQTAFIATWTRPALGREDKAVAYGSEVMAFWNGQASAGRCSAPELYLYEDGRGLWIVKGDRDSVMRIHDTEEAQMLSIKGELLLEGFHVEFCLTGDSASEAMDRYTAAVSAIS